MLLLDLCMVQQQALHAGGSTATDLDACSKFLSLCRAPPAPRAGLLLLHIGGVSNLL